MRCGPSSTNVLFATTSSPTLPETQVTASLSSSPRWAINTKGQLELHLTVPGPDVWTSLLTAMAVIRQSGYTPIAVHILDNPESTTTHVQAPGNDSN